MFSRVVERSCWMKNSLLSEVKHFRDVQGHLRRAFYAGFNFLWNLMSLWTKQERRRTRLELCHDGYNLLL